VNCISLGSDPCNVKYPTTHTFHHEVRARTRCAPSRGTLQRVERTPATFSRLAAVVLVGRRCVIGLGLRLLLLLNLRPLCGPWWARRRAHHPHLMTAGCASVNGLLGQTDPTNELCRSGAALAGRILVGVHAPRWARRTSLASNLCQLEPLAHTANESIIARMMRVGKKGATTVYEKCGAAAVGTDIPTCLRPS
jgi:hypothetical protein